MERFVLLPSLPTILPLSSLVRLPPSYNFLIRSPSLEKSGALRLPAPPQDIQDWLTSGAVRLHTKEENQLPGATVQALPPPIEKYFFGQISLDQLILLLDNAPNDPGALQQAVHNFRSSKRARIDVASIPRQPVPQPPPPPFSPPTSPTAPSSPPPPTPLSPAAPVPPPFPVSSASTYVSPDVPSTTSDPTPRSRTPRREPDSVLPTLEPGDRPPPWNPAPGIEPVGAPGTTPLRPPAPGLSSSAHSPRDIRDFNPPDPDLQKGKGKGKAPDRGRGRGNQGHSRGPGNGKGKHKGKIIGKDQGKGASPAASRSSTPPTAIYAPRARGKGHK